MTRLLLALALLGCGQPVTPALTNGAVALPDRGLTPQCQVVTVDACRFVVCRAEHGVALVPYGACNPRAEVTP